MPAALGVRGALRCEVKPYPLSAAHGRNDLVVLLKRGAVVERVGPGQSRAVPVRQLFDCRSSHFGRPVERSPRPDLARHPLVEPGVLGPVNDDECVLRRGRGDLVAVVDAGGGKKLVDPFHLAPLGQVPSNVAADLEAAPVGLVGNKNPRLFDGRAFARAGVEPGDGELVLYLQFGGGKNVRRAAVGVNKHAVVGCDEEVPPRALEVNHVAGVWLVDEANGVCEVDRRGVLMVLRDHMLGGQIGKGNPPGAGEYFGVGAEACLVEHGALLVAVGVARGHLLPDLFGDGPALEAVAPARAPGGAERFEDGAAGPALDQEPPLLAQAELHPGVSMTAQGARGRDALAALLHVGESLADPGIQVEHVHAGPPGFGYGITSFSSVCGCFSNCILTSRAKSTASWPLSWYTA